MSEFDFLDTEAVEERDEAISDAVALIKANEDADFKWLMKGPTGRRIVRRLLSFYGGPNNSSWTGPNALQLAFNEGSKQMSYWLLAEVKRLCPSDLIFIMQEPKND